MLLHGGPGADHSTLRPAYSALADIAQLIYLDHRGNGRSEDRRHPRFHRAAIAAKNKTGARGRRFQNFEETYVVRNWRSAR
jgi:pimeloyl-ACP methyl ester carboxylesterase